MWMRRKHNWVKIKILLSRFHNQEVQPSISQILKKIQSQSKSNLKNLKKPKKPKKLKIYHKDWIWKNSFKLKKAFLKKCMIQLTPGKKIWLKLKDWTKGLLIKKTIKKMFLRKQKMRMISEILNQWMVMMILTQTVENARPEVQFNQWYSLKTSKEIRN